MPVMAALAPIFHAEATRNTDALFLRVAERPETSQFQALSGCSLG
jgi:hypothetical protein